MPHVTTVLLLAASLWTLPALRAASPSARGEPQTGRLAAAAGQGDLAGVRRALAASPDANAPDSRGRRPLSLAARGTRLEIMAVLLDAGADPNLADAGGNRWVPLMHAVHKHQPEAVRFLLAHGARPDGSPDLRLTPLMMAVASGQTDVARQLLDRGADPSRPIPGGGSLLTLAVSGGALTDIDEPLLGACHPDTVRLLLDRAPGLRIGRTWRGWLARLFARLNGCGDVLHLVAGRVP